MVTGCRLRSGCGEVERGAGLTFWWWEGGRRLDDAWTSKMRAKGVIEVGTGMRLHFCSCYALSCDSGIVIQKIHTASLGAIRGCNQSCTFNRTSVRIVM